MAGGRLGFWAASTNAIIAFLLLVFVIIMAALLVESLVFGYPATTRAEVEANTAPVGRIYQRAD